jgi:thymidylate synthase
MRGVTEELLWFLRGETNIQSLVEAGVSIWTDWPLKRYRQVRGPSLFVGDGRASSLNPKYSQRTDAAPYQDEFENRIVDDDEFAEKWGDLGPIYGKQWRDFEGLTRKVDQIKRLIEGLREKPYSRRHLVSAWNPAQIEDMALPPCHYAFQCLVDDGRLSLMWQQRSVDSFLGLPFNIASYALLTHMLAQQADLTPHELIFSGGDCHIYKNHVEKVEEQLTREPYDRPTLHLRERDSIDDYTVDDVTIENYEHHPALKAPIAV